MNKGNKTGGKTKLCLQYFYRKLFLVKFSLVKNDISIAAAASNPITNFVFIIWCHLYPENHASKQFWGVLF